MAGRGRAPFLGGNAAPVQPAAALTRAGLALYTWYLATDEIVWSSNAAAVLGLASANLIATGEALCGMVEPGDGASPLEAVRASEQTDAGAGVPYRSRYALRTRPDRLLMVEDLGRWYADAHGRPALLRGTLRAEPQIGGDVLSANLEARNALLALIFEDVRETQRSRRAVTLVVGRLGGVAEDVDAALAQIAERARPLLRHRDRLVRYGPDRFALALASCPAADAVDAMRRLSGLIGEVSVRLGAATAPDHAVDAPQLLRRAEEALEGGEAGFRVYRSASASTRARCGGTAAADLIDALNERRLVAAYRPAIEARGRRPIFATLVPQVVGPAGPVPIGDLEQAAAAAGLSALVDARLVELAAERLARHPEETVALDVLSASWQDGEWLHALAAHLGARPGIASRLVVAVHESALTDAAIWSRLDAVKALGARIMLAGFGTGHAGSRDLRGLPLDVVRVDAALVQTLTRSPADRLLVRALVDLARHCGIATLAEGVDDHASAALLDRWGVDWLDGGIVREAGPRPEPQARGRGSRAA